MSAKKSKTTSPKQLKQNYNRQKHDFFDEAEENMDALQMEQHHDPQYNELLKASPHANINKNSYFFTNERYQTNPHPAESSQDEEEP